MMYKRISTSEPVIIDISAITPDQQKSVAYKLPDQANEDRDSVRMLIRMARATDTQETDEVTALRI